MAAAIQHDESEPITVVVGDDGEMRVERRSGNDNEIETTAEMVQVEFDDGTIG